MTNAIDNTAGIMASDTVKRVELQVRGIVQGVGFRPYVYRLAQEHHISGLVRNTSDSVQIEMEGHGDDIDSFLKELKIKAPPQSFIEHITIRNCLPVGIQGFHIVPSIAQEDKYQLVSPDIATCDDCFKELFSLEDRRYYYPFTNCTNCGPRFTIIEDIPYDRFKTTMRKFHMCPECQQEYDDPTNRRFHAEPNACPACGPSLTIIDKYNEPIICKNPIREAARLLVDGRIVAIKGLGGFLLACDATNRETVSILRERKRRPDKPFAVMVSTIEEAKYHCLISKDEGRLLKSSQCPIVLLRKKISSICEEVAPALHHLGLMLPYTPLHHLLLREVDMPLVMTSGNLSDEPITSDNDEALTRLEHIADYFLVHNRDIFSRYDDSVFIVEGGRNQAIRRARGFSPYPIFLPFETKPVLACGAEVKNTFCLTRDNHAFLSQHIGDLEDEKTLVHFEHTIALYERLFRIKPEAVAYDLHPEYLSTKYARALLERNPGLKEVPVQHHHAHIVSCMIENGITAPVIGVAFDGAGLGTDGHIWGGEFMIADCQRFERVGHLEYVPMPGGQAAIKKPFRMAIGYLLALDLDYLQWPILQNINPVEIEVIKRQVERGINSPLTSSAGRLCDAVAALTGVRHEISYEGQAAIELEAAAYEGPQEVQGYPFSIIQDSGMNMVMLRELLAAIVRDIESRTPVPVISSRFHHTIADIIVKMCLMIGQRNNLKQVALSGGVFQNRLLFRSVTAALRDEGFEVLTHSLVPTNDGGIALGQAAVAHFNA